MPFLPPTVCTLAALLEQHFAGKNPWRCLVQKIKENWVIFEGKTPYYFSISFPSLRTRSSSFRSPFPWNGGKKKSRNLSTNLQLQGQGIFFETEKALEIGKFIHEWFGLLAIEVNMFWVPLYRLELLIWISQTILNIVVRFKTVFQSGVSNQTLKQHYGEEKGNRGNRGASLFLLS